jgi:hypothetical protein
MLDFLGVGSSGAGDAKNRAQKLPECILELSNVSGVKDQVK